MLTVATRKVNLRRDFGHGDAYGCTQIRRILSGIPTKFLLGRYFVIFQMSVDESGYGQTQPDSTFVLAGYVASLETWETFADACGDVFGDPRSGGLTTEQFKQLVRRKGPTHAAVAKMRDIIKDCSLSGVRYAMTYATLKRTLLFAQNIGWNPNALFKTVFFTNPYALSFLALFLRVLNTLKSESVLLEFIYDENLAEKRKIETGYAIFLDVLRGNHPEFLPKVPKLPLPRNDEEFFPLRAADMLAWHSRKACVEQYHNRQYSDDIWLSLNAMTFMACLSF